MDLGKIEGYIDLIYAYAVKRTFTEEEAADLSQDILYTLVKELPHLRAEDRFEPWLWSVAANVTRSFRRRLGKQRAMFSYGIPEYLAYEEDFEQIEDEELASALREKIAMMSAIYRDIIILHYYDGLSVKDISVSLGIPEGTVTWRLSEARRKLKKECSNMETSALRPVRMNIDIYGSGNYDGKTVPFPSAYINDSLSQNILYYCYESAHTVEEISKLCGVPAYYIEERVDNLLRRNAVIEQSKGKYRTDLVIWSDKYGIYCEEHAEKMLMPIMDRMIAAYKAIADETRAIGHYKAEKSEADLLYLYGIMAMEYADKVYCRLPRPEHKPNYDDFSWRYIANMESGKHRRISIVHQCCRNIGSRGSYSHDTYGRFAGIPAREMMYDSYINVCEDLLTAGTTEDLDSAANAIRDGYIVRRDDGSMLVTCPAFTKEQKAEFDMIADKHLAPLMCEYSAIVEKFVSGYKKLFPAHLGDDADRMCRGIFVALYTVIIEYAQRTGVIDRPTEGSYCDVMVQFK